MGRVDADVYVLVHVIAVAGWPLLLLIGDGSPVIAITAFALNLAMFVSVWRACSSPACGYWGGMQRVAGSLMSGCANITILYLPLVLAFVHLLATLYAVLGLFPSLKPASLWWEGLVRNFSGRSSRPLSLGLGEPSPEAALPPRVVRSSLKVPPPPRVDASGPPVDAGPPRGAVPADRPAGPAPVPADAPEAAPPSRLPALLAPRPRSPGKALHFSHLPVSARDRLAAATRGPSRSRDLLSLPLESSTPKRYGVAVGAAGLAGLFALALATGPWSTFGDGRTSFGGWWLLALPAFGATALLVFQAARLRLFAGSRVHPALVANPLLLARTGLDHEPVEIHYLGDLLSFDAEHHYANGAYSRTDLSARFRTGRMDFSLGSRLDSDWLSSFLRSAPERLVAWEKEGGLEARIAQEDWLGLLPGSGPGPGTGRAPGAPWSASRGNLLLLSVSLSLVLTGAAWGANLLVSEWSLWRDARRTDAANGYRSYLKRAPFLWYEDEAKELFDEALWRKAVAEDQPHSYSNYVAGSPLKRHREEARSRSEDAQFRNTRDSIRALRGYGERVPAPPHAAEVQPRIAELYRNAMAAYPPDVPGVDPDAAAAVKALLVRAVESGSPEVLLVFEPMEPLRSEVIEGIVSELTGKTNVQPMARSFSEEKNRAREEGIATAIERALGRVLPEGALELRRGPAVPGLPILSVSCEILPSGSLYQEKDPMDELLARGGLASSPAMKELEERMASRKPVFVGIRFRFRLLALLPGEDGTEGEEFGFSMEAEPAPNLKVEGRPGAFGTEAEKVYDVMADSACNEFSRELARRFGAGGPPPGTKGE